MKYSYTPVYEGVCECVYVCVRACACVCVNVYRSYSDPSDTLNGEPDQHLAPINQSPLSCFESQPIRAGRADLLRKRCPKRLWIRAARVTYLVRYWEHAAEGLSFHSCQVLPFGSHLTTYFPENSWKNVWLKELTKFMQRLETW